jgi:hypothetical protein
MIQSRRCGAPRPDSSSITFVSPNDLGAACCAIAVRPEMGTAHVATQNALDRRMVIRPE